MLFTGMYVIYILSFYHQPVQRVSLLVCSPLTRWKVRRRRKKNPPRGWSGRRILRVPRSGGGGGGCLPQNTHTHSHILTHTLTCTHTLSHTFSTDSSLVSKWDRGCILGTAQNFARELMESPANHMTPTMFVEAVSNKLGGMRHSLSSPGSLQLVPRLAYCN